MMTGFSEPNLISTTAVISTVGFLNSGNLIKFMPFIAVYRPLVGQVCDALVIIL